ncbi:peptidylprolyl isomerase [Pseudaminobacter arsenicus]|uniref:Peptidylprolyl isomerase n=1 Tax=Borborobacter arsenicus TaxID=1851146 RepID=A0A432V2N6_9HYPH|nr:peptidylprolyl isomerase [Pseudaminobacter arsenicus]RUM96441.1 peptidylprolyl isomerase [Pseudaminobacter arsenicus]
MSSIRKYLFSTSFALLVAASAIPAAVSISPAQASEIKYVVNNVPITTYDIQRRAAFMKLQHRKGNLNKLAADEMIEQTLRVAETKRLGINVSDQQVEDAFARFASSNKMSTKQLTGALSQAGVTAEHFKDFIRAQMSWNQALSSRYRSQGGTMSEQDVVRRMLEQGGSKPSATEYMLQQVIFVVPAKERGNIGKRKREAEAMRARFSGCESTRQFAKGLLDVTVRDLGRVLAPELPAEWADQIKKTKTGGATPVRQTDRGIEFIGICSAREVSDDKVAKMVFQSEGNKDEQAEAMSKRYIAELREKARIVER